MTPNQLKVLEFIKQFISEQGYSPSLQEICKHMQWKARSQAHNTVKQLAERNFIKYLPNRSRSVVVL